MELTTVKLSRLKAAPWRLSDKGPDTRETVNVVHSLKKYGQLRPILVRLAADGFYQIIDGHVVAEAAKAAGLDELSCIVHDLGDDAARRVYIHLKLNRTVKNHVEIRKLLAQIGDVELIAEAISWPVDRIRDYIELSDRDLNWREFKYVVNDKGANDQGPEPKFG
jgi:ParB-like chromosome segregation protein Spo0J